MSSNIKLHQRYTINNNDFEVWTEDGKQFCKGLKYIRSEYGIWYFSGKKIHREDGPAIITPSTIYYWVIDGYMYRFDDYISTIKSSDEDMLALILKYGDSK